VVGAYRDCPRAASAVGGAKPIGGNKVRMLLRRIRLHLRLYLLLRKICIADYPEVLKVRTEALRTLRELNMLRMR